MSILTSIKKLLGIEEGYTHYDVDIIMHINSAFFVLNRLGLGPDTGFRIESDVAVWEDILDTRVDLELVKTYIYMRVKRIFDPPPTSFGIDVFDREIDEATFRITNQLEEVT